MNPWTNKHSRACANNIMDAAEDFKHWFDYADIDGTYPARIRDFVCDIEQHCHHMRAHLKEAQKKAVTQEDIAIMLKASYK